MAFNSAVPAFIVVLWAVAGVVCATGMKALTPGAPASSARRRSVSLLGLLVTSMAVFMIAVTILVPVAIFMIPAPVAFAVLIFRPTLAQKSLALRAYLLVCVILSALIFSIGFIWLLWAHSR